MVEPQSVIYLCRTPLESDYKNQLTFANITAQTTYFETTWVRSFGTGTGKGYTYVRKENKIILECKIDEVIGCNYLYYRNVGFSNKTYYCFITKMEYINEESTAVYIETDVFQTYMFDIHYHPCFIEREHVADDTVGLHTIPEPLETGEYEIVDVRGVPLYEKPAGSTSTIDTFVPCFCVTDYPSDIQNLNTFGKVQGDDNQVGGVFSSLKFFSTKDVIEAGIPAYYNSKLIEDLYNRSGQSVTADAIKNVYMIPSCMVNEKPVWNSEDLASYVQINLNNVAYRIPFYSIKNYYYGDEIDLREPQHLAENYVPVNKKLLTYPFSYFYASNGVGVENEYHYEDFPLKPYVINNETVYERTVTYQVAMVASCGVSAKLYFTNYKSFDTDVNPSYLKEIYNYGIPFAKLPVCAWTTDYYTNWLTQNSVNNSNTIASSVATGVLAGAMVGGLAGALVGGATSFLGSITQAHNKERIAKTTPDSAKGDINTGDFQFCFKRNAINLYQMSIRPEMARIIDDYFSMFGYKVNIVKTLQFNSRPNWNYVKTIGCNIDGQIPQEDVDTIRKMFDTGVTMWHNPSTMYDYTQNNNV